MALTAEGPFPIEDSPELGGVERPAVDHLQDPTIAEMDPSITVARKY